MIIGCRGKKWSAVASLLLFVLLATSTFANCDEIILVADEWCPYNCTPGGNEQGYIVEVAKHALESEGHKVVYKIVPWARAIRGTRIGIYDGIIGAGKDEVPDFIFPKKEVGHVSHTFYVSKQSTWKFQGLDSLSNLKLGVIKNYSYGTLYNEYIKPNDNNPKKISIVTGDNDPLTRNIQMLMSGRVDVIVEDQNVMKHYFMTKGENNPLLAAGVASNEDVYIAFSPANNKSILYASILDNAMHQLKKSGLLKEILRKYGIKE